MSNQFQVEVFYQKPRENVDILTGWSTVYVTEGDNLADARRQLRYIMSTPFTRGQYSNPDAVRVIRNNRVYIQHLSESMYFKVIHS